MVSSISAQIIESLRIVQDIAASLGESQELIELALQKSLRDVMAPERRLEFLPADDVVGRLHGVVVFPP